MKIEFDKEEHILKHRYNTAKMNVDSIVYLTIYQYQYEYQSVLSKKILFATICLNNIYNYRSMNCKESEQRIYFSLIQSAGSWHRYQLYIFIISLAISIIESSQIFILPYLFQQNPYQCDGLDSSLCEQFVCSLPPHQRTQFIPQQPFTSLANSFASVDFRCEYKSLLIFFSTLVFIAMIISFIAFTFFTENFGRKRSLLLSMFLILIGNLFILLSSNLESIFLIIVGISFTYGGTEVAYQLIYCYAVEVIKEQKRVSYMNILNGAYGLGMILNSLLFFSIGNWFTIYSCIYVPLIIVIILAIISLIEKTPLDLLASQNPRQILQVLDGIARTNQVELSITLNEIEKIQQIYYMNVENKRYFSIVDLLRFESLRKSSIVLFFLNFFTIYIFYSPAAIHNSDQKDLFMNGVSDGVSYSISVIITYFLMVHCPRKIASFSLFTLSLIFEIVLYGMKDILNTQYQSIYFIYRLLISSNFSCVYFINYETFPTQIRAVGAMFAYAIGCSSGIIQPIVSQSCRSQSINAFLPFIIITLLGMITSFFVKQTFGVAPPQSIEQLAVGKFQAQGLR